MKKKTATSIGLVLFFMLFPSLTQAKNVIYVTDPHKDPDQAMCQVYSHSCNAIVCLDTCLAGKSISALWHRMETPASSDSLIFDHMSMGGSTAAWGLARIKNSNSPCQRFVRIARSGLDITYGEIPGYTGFMPGMITAASEDIAWATFYNTNSNQGKVLKTTDGGQNWTDQPSAVFDMSLGAFPNIIHFWDENTGVVIGDPSGGYWEIYTTTNGGGQWNRVNAAAIPAMVSGEFGIISLYCVQGDRIYFSTNRSRIYMSTDRGLSWSVMSTPVPSGNTFDLAFFNPTRGVIRLKSTANTLWETYDGGTSWQVVNYSGTLGRNKLKYVPGTNATLISTNGGFGYGITYSQDGGASWYDYPNSTGEPYYGLACYDANTAWTGGRTEQGNHRIYRYFTVNTPVNIDLQLSEPYVCEYQDITITPKTNAPYTQMQISADNGVPNLVYGSSATMQFFGPGTFRAWVGGTTPYGTYYQEFHGAIKVMAKRNFEFGPDIYICEDQCVEIGFSPDNALLISEYIEGSAYNRAFELYNAGNTTIHLHDYALKGNSNGNAWNYFHRLPQGHYLDPGQVIVIAHSWADTAILNRADLIYDWNQANYLMNYNGDDVRALCRISQNDTIIIDVIGDNNLSDPGSGWDVAGIPEGTFNHTLVRKPIVSGPNNIWPASAGLDSVSSEWLVFPMDDYTHLGWHASSPALVYQWNTGQQSDSITVCPVSTSSYRLSVTDERGCMAFDVIEIGLAENINFSLGIDTLIPFGQCINLTPFAQRDLFFSEYVEGTNVNKALEVFNPLPYSIDLDNYRIIGTNNGNGWDPFFVYLFPQGSVLPARGPFTIIHPGFDPVLFHPDSADALADGLSNLPVNFNGNDARGLQKWSNGQWRLIDVIGDPDSDVYWPVAGISNALNEHTIIRKPHISNGNPDWYTAAGTNASNSEWLVFSQNYVADLAKHTFQTTPFQYNWSTGENTEMITVCPIQANFYSLTITDTNGCNAVDSILISVLSAPCEITGDSVVCEGDTARLQATPGMVSYLWSTGDTTSEILLPYSGTSSTILYLTVTDTSGAQLVITSHPITGYAKPTFNTNQTLYYINEGDSLTLSPLVQPAHYLWSTGDTTLFITVFPVHDTSYTIEAWYHPACRTTLTYTIVVHPALQVSADTVICIGDCISIWASGNGSYLWSTGDTTDTIQVCPTSQYNTYCVTITSPENNTSTACISVDVDMISFELDIDGPSPVCKGTCTTLEIRRIGHTQQGTYVWENGSDSSRYLVCPNISEFHYITITTDHGCVRKDSIYLEVLTLTPTLLYSPGPYCENHPPIRLQADYFGTFTGHGIINDTLYPILAGHGTWTVSYTYTDLNGCTTDTAFLITIMEMPVLSIQQVGGQCSNSGAIQLIANPPGGTFSGTGVSGAFFDPVVAGQGIWEVMYTYTTTEGCTGSTSIDIPVYPIPDISIDPVPEFCANDAAFLLSGSPSGLTFSGPGVFQNTFDPAIAGVGSHNIGFIVADTTGCSNAGGLNITVYPLPVAEAGMDDTIFGGGCVSLTASGGTTYQWSTGQSTQSISACNTTTMVYSVTVTNPEGCADVDSLTVFFFDTTTLIVSQDTSICEGECVTLMASGNGNITWSHGPSGSPVTVCPVSTTTYFVSLTDPYGQVMTESIEVIVYPKPVASTTQDTVVCQNECISLEAFGGAGYYWSTGETGSLITVCPTSATVYSVSVVSSEGCTDTASVNVNVHPNPQVSLNPDTTIAQDSCVQLEASGGLHYAWSTGEINQSILVCPIQSETYSVTVTDTNGCTAHAEVDIYIDMPSFGFRAKVFLQGPYQQNGRMNTSRATNAYIPLSQPYNSAPWYYDGNETLDSIPSDMVDWLLVELRSPGDSTLIYVRKAVILLADGSILDEHMDSSLSFIYYAKTPMYVVIDHLSHLPLMTAQPVDLANRYYDFSNPSQYPLYGNSSIAAIEVASGVHAMIAGDLNNDYRLKYSGSNNDRSPVLTKVLSITGGTSITSTTSGYFPEDINMDGFLKYSGSNNDPSRIIQNLVQLTGSQSITSTFTCPVPPGRIFISPQYCGLDLLDIRDGQSYPTVQIGNQCWMAKNLNIGEMMISSYTGYSHSSVSNNGITEKYCQNNDSSNCLIYGGLYDWDEMMNYTTMEGARGICPYGWHIPTDAEWCTLLSYLEPMVDCDAWGGSGTNVGGKLKKTGLDHWISPNYGAINSSGFTAFGAGIRHQEGIYAGFNTVAYFWSSSTYSNGNGVSRDMNYGHADVNRHAYYKTYGFSLRCIGDNIPPCAPQPDQANAGPDSLNIPGTSINLQANTPVHGSGQWTIANGQGGSFACDTTPTTTFTGATGESYALIWTISNHCGSTSDSVMLHFAEPVFACGDSLVDGRDMQSYPTVQIGTQCWMASNLNTGVMVTSVHTGANHADVSDNGITEKYCYDNDSANCLIYGGLYDWNEMMNYTIAEGTQGVCPLGWHIPTDVEWHTMIIYLGANAGSQMKEAGINHWNAPNTGATNSSGFTALGGGCRSNLGQFTFLKIDGYFWSSSEFDATTGLRRGLSYDYTIVGRTNNMKTYGFSVRCIWDGNSP